MPKVTNGGRTYTFHVRSGYGFSPPSHEPVTPSSFRHALERFLSPAARNNDPLRLLGDIVGAKAYASGRASRVSGIEAHGDTLAIRLLRPAGDLPARLALPSFCAVPAELPTVPHGLPYLIPSAGPYYLADRSADVLVLKPNPNYHGPRPSGSTRSSTGSASSRAWPLPASHRAGSTTSPARTLCLHRAR